MISFFLKSRPVVLTAGLFYYTEQEEEEEYASKTGLQKGRFLIAEAWKRFCIGLHRFAEVVKKPLHFLQRSVEVCRGTKKTSASVIPCIIMSYNKLAEVAEVFHNLERI